MGDGEEGMRATFSRVDAAIAVAPFTFVAVVAFPEAVVGEGGADGAECTRLEACCGDFRR